MRRWNSRRDFGADRQGEPAGPRTEAVFQAVVLSLIVLRKEFVAQSGPKATVAVQKPLFDRWVVFLDSFKQELGQSGPSHCVHANFVENLAATRRNLTNNTSKILGAALLNPSKNAIRSLKCSAQKGKQRLNSMMIPNSQCRRRLMLRFCGKASLMYLCEVRKILTVNCIQKIKVLFSESPVINAHRAPMDEEVGPIQGVGAHWQRAICHSYSTELTRCQLHPIEFPQFRHL